MSTRFRAVARRTRLFLVPVLAVSGCLLVEPPGALKSQPTDGTGADAGSDAMNAGGSGAVSGTSGKAGAHSSAGSAGRSTGASGNGDGAGAAGESSGASGGGATTAGAGGSTTAGGGGSTTAGAGGGSAGQNSGGMHAGGTSGGGMGGGGMGGGGTAGSSAGGTSGGSAGAGGAATVDPYSGNFRVLILSTVVSTAFAHLSIPDCQAMLGFNSGVANPPAAFNQTSDAAMPTGTKVGSQFTADLAADTLADFTDANLKKYAIVFSCNPAGPVFSASPNGIVAMAALKKYVEGGGAWGGVHAATDFEETNGFPWFTDVLVGAYFSSHDPYPKTGVVTIQSAATNHPVMTGLMTPFSTDDEWYTMNRDPAPKGLQILARLADNRPVVWVRELCPNAGTTPCAPSPTNGRSFYTTRGHDKSAYKEVEFRKLVLNGILWATHRLEQQ